VKLNIHIVFEGEKEFHRSVKLWGVSIIIVFLFFLKKAQTLSFLSFKTVWFSPLLCLLKEIQLHVIQ